MNVKTLIAAATLTLIGTTAFAWEAPDLATPSTKSRADVRAELMRAQNAGEIIRTSQPYYSFDAALAAAKTQGRGRAEVVSELANAGPAVSNEAYGTVVVAESVRSRADVQAEAALSTNNERQYSGE